jgi:23S rRNA pseudouridine2605 synthase
MLHKPEGYVTTTKDPFGRKTVMSLLDLLNTRERLYPVGRLDFDTSGLLILTNDGELTFALTHPGKQVEKTYVAKVRGIPAARELASFSNGLKIDNYVTAPAKAEVINKSGGKPIGSARVTQLRIVLREGKSRQVRKMCEAIGHPVISLKRIATGKLFLGDLPKGAWRALTKSEVGYLKGLGHEKQ